MGTRFKFGDEYAVQSVGRYCNGTLKSQIFLFLPLADSYGGSDLIFLDTLSKRVFMNTDKYVFMNCCLQKETKKVVLRYFCTFLCLPSSEMIIFNRNNDSHRCCTCNWTTAGEKIKIATSSHYLPGWFKRMSLGR